MQTHDKPDIRAARIAAYRRGVYMVTAPPVCSHAWGAEDWCNVARFDDPSLNGWVRPIGSRILDLDQ